MGYLFGFAEVKCVLVSFDMVEYGMVDYGMVWYDRVWHSMVECGRVWYIMI